jgi:hypothetical protein
VEVLSYILVEWNLKEVAASMNVVVVAQLSISLLVDVREFSSNY